MHLGLALAVSLFIAAQPEPPPIAPTEARTPEGEREGFHLPPGFEVQLVAAEPDIIHPINIAFDARGRLWVTTSIEYPFPAKGLKTKDAVKVLEDFGPDGRARKITTFADNLNIPIGVLPLKSGAIVHSIPDVWRMSDTRGTGKADKRDVLLASIGYRDTHGMTGNFVRGFDGWIYATHGFANNSIVKGTDGSAITMTSGNTYRFKEDGTRVEHFTNGQVNPFGLCFDPLGNLFSCDCHSRPIYQLLRGAFYPSFGRPHDGLGFGPEMMQHSHGSTAISGIVYYAADNFPKEFRDNIFIGNVVTNRINRDRLDKHGSTYLAVEQPDLLKSDDPWFRPVSMQLGPDGAMYVADFYNRIIGHYEVPLTHPGRDKSHGRIWRIAYRPGKAGTPAPRRDWTKATAVELVQDLAHPNLAVRLLATNELVDRGKASIDAVRKVMLKREASALQRMHGLWVLERLGALDDVTLTTAGRVPENGIRVHAMRVLAERSDLSPVERGLVLGALKDADPFVQRCAADVLGRHPGPANLGPLLELRHHVPAADTHFLHVVRMALRDQLLAKAAWQEVNVRKWSSADLQALADVCLGVPSAEAARFLLAHLSELRAGEQRLLDDVRHIARYGDQEPAEALALLAPRRGVTPVILARLIRAIQQGTQERGTAVTPAVQGWADKLARTLLGSGWPDDMQAGAELAAQLKIGAVQRPLATLLVDRRAPVALRRAAAEALNALDSTENARFLGSVLGNAADPLPLREQVAALLGSVGRPAPREELLKALTSAPAKLQSAIALALAGSRTGAEKLLDAVGTGKASARLLQEPAVRQRLGQSRIPNLDQRLAGLTHGLPSPNERLQALINQRSAGFARAKANPGLGALVFEKTCAVCHQIANKGARIAPQLDGVGARGVDRLLEDILDPSRNVDQAFRATTLSLTDGQVVFGLLLREEGQVLVLMDSQGKEQRIPSNTVESRFVSQVSPMPANFGKQLSPPELYNLLAYLLEQRAPAVKAAGR
jgi:putative heme-binding domain-containing protein